MVARTPARTEVFAFATFVLFVISLALWNQRRIAKRESFIRNYELPRGLFDNLRKRRPELSLNDCQLSANALRLDWPFSAGLRGALP